MSADVEAQQAWLAYRNEYQASRWWLRDNPQRAARQLRRRDFIAGYLAATDLLAQARREGQRDGWDEGYEAFAAQFTKPMDEAGQRPRATNPYRDNQTGASQ